ncbi:uncharacterized protein LOC127254577 [Andrographis paniculata]|uniref:uncharacterized protein LOC127254577 n=1 Tax=Andrographis paniculata TaxID=175694 RepID=UPI0021E91BC2|nr:uncharacterized protein LOC127254577 [Andrographis paniculata]
MEISRKERTMEGEENEEMDLTPFWLQSTADHRRRRGVSSFFLSSGLVVFLLLVMAAAFLAFVLPSTLSFSAQIFRPNSVKKSWDSLNVVLVLVAVVFGFLSRNKNEERYGYYDGFQNQEIRGKESETQKSSSGKWEFDRTDGGQSLNLSNSREWFGFSDSFERKNSFLRRNSISYPDLRESSSVDLWDYGGDYRRRFYDDYYADPGRVTDSGRVHRRHRSLEEVEIQSRSPPPPPPPPTKTIIVDTLVTKSNEAENIPPPPTAAPVAEPSDEKPKGKGRKERSKRKPSKDLEQMRSTMVSTPPPSPPPPPPQQQKSSKSDRKRGGATGSATKEFLNSLYHKKKKKQRQKSVDNLDSLLHEAPPPLSFHLSPPTAQSPSPSSSSSPSQSVLQNLFSSKKQKRKRTIKVTLAPHPKPNPNSQIGQSSTQNPQKPIKLRTFEKLEETSNSGGESPLNRIPPPPPPPPPGFFKTPAWKFVVQGDYVRVNSTASSRSGSPDTEDLDSDFTPSAAFGGNTTPFHPSPLFCASPDVNTKAESFITSFRAKLKLEKIHSMNKREPGLSTLGPRQI